MSANKEQASNNGPMPCKSGCGFFGSEATGGCCSKCWMATIKIKQTTPAAPAIADVPDSNEKTPSIAENVDQSETSTKKTATSKQLIEEVQTAAPSAGVTAPLKKKKKKKTGYKNMMASMMAGSDKKDFAKDKELLAKGLGGGNFSKVEKI